MTLYPRIWFADGFTLCPGLVFIRAQYRDDLALRAHEAVHERQMREIGLLRWWWRYLTSKSARAGYEVEAYREQARVNGLKAENYSVYLANGYALKISELDAQTMLSDKIQ